MTCYFRHYCERSRLWPSPPTSNANGLSANGHRAVAEITVGCGSWASDKAVSLGHYFGDGAVIPVFYSSEVQALDKFGKNMFQPCS
jgi:hypothetical protein